MGMKVLGVGFLMILSLLFYQFFNQMPDYLDGFSNIITLLFIIVVGLAIIMAAPK